MAEFTETIIAGLESPPPHDPKEKLIKDYIPRIREIQDTVRKFGLNPDIEAILSVLQGRVNPKKALNDIGPLITVFSQEFRNTADDTLASVAVTEIENLIYDTCMKQIKHELAVKLYGELWDSLTGNFSVRMGRNNIQWLGQSGIQRIFTTNYDSSVETFLKNRKIGFD